MPNQYSSMSPDGITLEPIFTNPPGSERKASARPSRMSRSNAGTRSARVYEAPSRSLRPLSSVRLSLVRMSSMDSTSSAIASRTTRSMDSRGKVRSTGFSAAA